VTKVAAVGNLCIIALFEHTHQGCGVGAAVGGASSAFGRERDREE